MSGHMQWFRLYSRIVDDEKLKLLAFEDRWHFVALCCLKSTGLLDEPDSDLRSRKIAVKLGVQVREMDEIARRLREVELIDEHLVPVAWSELQFRSDQDATAARRQREKRQRDKALKTVTRDAPVTDTDVTRLETEAETEEEVVPNGTTARSGARKADPWPKPDWADSQHFADLKANRKSKRLPNTPTAYVKFLRDLEQWVDDDWPPGRVLEAIAARGWASAEHDPRGNRNHERSPPQRFTGNSTLRELAERSIAGR